MDEYPPLPLWQHLELGILNFNSFNSQLKDRFPAEYNAINKHLSEMTRIFVSAVEKMEAETAMYGTRYAVIGRPVHLIPYLRPAPQRYEFDAIAGSVPGSPSTLSSVPGGSHDEFGGSSRSITPAIFPRPRSTALGMRAPPGLGVTSLLSNINASHGAVESTTALRWESGIDYGGLPNAPPRSAIMARRAQIALTHALEQGVNERQEVDELTVEALREHEATLKEKEAVAQLKNRASGPCIARNDSELQLDLEALKKQEVVLKEGGATQQIENRPSGPCVAQEDGQSQTETNSSIFQLRSSLDADTHATMPPVEETIPRMSNLISTLKTTIPQTLHARACDNSIRLSSRFAAQFGGSKSSNWRRSDGDQGSSESSMATQTPSLRLETQSSQVEAPSSVPLVEPKVESMAQKLAKMHEQETSEALAAIPTKSTTNSWAGIAVRGVKEVEKKEINMRVKVQSPPGLPARTFTTIGRVRPKSIDGDAINSQEENHNKLMTKLEEVRVEELELRHCHNISLDGIATPRDLVQELPECDSKLAVAPVSDTAKLVVEEPLPATPIRHEAAVDQQRVVYLLNPPQTMTVAQVSDGIHEGALVAIRPGIDSTNGQLFFCIVFQFAPCLTNFLMVMEDERMFTRPDRFGFIANCVRDTKLYPYNEVLRAMEEPIFARRRLTLAKKGLFFEWKKSEIEEFLYTHVGNENIQFVHMYNGGNGTICFSEVEAAIKIKSILIEMVRTGAEDNRFCQLNISFSRDPCEAELRLLTDGVF